MDRKTFLYRGALISGAILIVVFFVIFLNRDDKKIKNQVKQGIEELNKLEEKNVADIEKLIAEMDEYKEPDSSQTLKDKMKDAIVLGDSITKALTGYHVIHDENVIAKTGVSLTQTKDLLKKAVELNKKKIFLAFGMNDLEATNGDEKLFRKQYKEVIDYLQEKIPDAELYVNSILPMKEIAFEKVKENAKYPEFNVELRSLCEEEKVVFIDNTDLVKDEYFEPDGIHMVYAFYKDWVNRMAEVGNL